MAQIFFVFVSWDVLPARSRCSIVGAIPYREQLDFRDVMLVMLLSKYLLQNRSEHRHGKGGGFTCSKTGIAQFV
jgi:hypothetical protein